MHAHKAHTHTIIHMHTHLYAHTLTQTHIETHTHIQTYTHCWICAYNSRQEFSLKFLLMLDAQREVTDVLIFQTNTKIHELKIQERISSFIWIYPHMGLETVIHWIHFSNKITFRCINICVRLSGIYRRILQHWNKKKCLPIKKFKSWFISNPF